VKLQNNTEKPAHRGKPLASSGLMSLMIRDFIMATNKR
jgi:hypothetical protein